MLQILHKFVNTITNNEMQPSYVRLHSTGPRIFDTLLISKVNEGHTKYTDGTALVIWRRAWCSSLDSARRHGMSHKRSYAYVHTYASICHKTVISRITHTGIAYLFGCVYNKKVGVCTVSTDREHTEYGFQTLCELMNHLIEYLCT